MMISLNVVLKSENIHSRGFSGYKIKWPIILATELELDRGTVDSVLTIIRKGWSKCRDLC